MQDDVGERTNTLQAMHRIYEEAIVIIVAGSGENAGGFTRINFLVLEALKR